MSEVVTLYIDEEYGYQHWRADLTADEYAALLRRWRSMRGLHCLVPVRLIVPQAVPVWAFADVNVHVTAGRVRCHIHEDDDSYLEGADCDIPPPDEFTADRLPVFYMDGKRYEFEADLRPLCEAERAFVNARLDEYEKERES